MTMASTVKKFCALFRCCVGHESANTQLAFENINTPIGWKVSKEKQDLFDFLVSYQRLKLSDGSPHHWATRAAQQAELLNMLGSAIRLAAIGDSAGVELACLNAALIVCFLPEHSEYYCTHLLNGVYEVLLQSESGRLGALLLLSTLLRIQRFRELVVRDSEFLNFLFQLFQSLVLEQSMQHLSPEQDSTQESSIIPEDQEYEISDDDISEESSIADQSITSESRPNESPKSQPVPKLDFNCSSLGGGGVFSALPIHSVNDSATGVWSDRWKSGRMSGKRALLSSSRHFLNSEKAKSLSKAREDGGSSSAECFTKEEEEEDAPRSDNAKITNMFLQKINQNEERMDEDLKGLRTIVQDLGLTKTIELLGIQNEASFALAQRKELIDLEQVWNLDKEWAHDNTMDTKSQEKIALFDIFLLLSESYHHSFASAHLCQTILTDFNHSLQSNSINPRLIRRAIATYLEYSAQEGAEIMDTQSGIHILAPPQTPNNQVDEFLKLLTLEIQKFTNISRPDINVLKKLEELLNIVSEYLAMSPAPLHIISCLVFPLDSLQTVFCDLGRVEDWRNVHLDTFGAFLGLYIDIFRNFAQTLDPILVRELLRSLMSENWISLLTSLSWWLTQGRECRWLHRNKRLRINLYIWSFLTIIAEAQMKSKEPSTSALLMEDFNSILAPRTGLVSRILVYLDQSGEMNAPLQAQVLRFLHASCFLVGSPLLDHEMEFDAYIKYLCFKFIELYELGISTTNNSSSRSTSRNEAHTSLMALHLEVLTSMVISCPSQSTIHLLKLKFVELIMNDLQGLETDRRSFKMMNPLLQPQYTPVEAYRSNSEASKSTSFSDGDASVHHLTRTSFSSTTHASIYGGARTPQEDREVDLSYSRLHLEELPTDALDEELFGRVSEEEEELESLASFTSDDSWPSDLSPTGDLDEDTLRLEIYLLRKAHEQGRLTLEEMHSKITEITNDVLGDDQERSSNLDRKSNNSVNPGRSLNVPSLAVHSSSPLTSSTPSDPAAIDTAQESHDEQLRFREDEDVVTQPMTQLLHLHHNSSSVLNLGLKKRLPNSQIAKIDELYLAAMELLLHVLLMLDKSSIAESNDLARKLSSLLYHHINHPQFKHLIPSLIQQAQERGPDSFRMLRLLLDGFFDIGLYTEVDRIYKGEVAHVKRCKLTQTGSGLPQMCIVKVMDFPMEYQSPDGSLLHIYSEVNIMEKLHNEAGFCQIYDYGLHGDTVYIVMENCQKSLQDWIHEFPSSSPWAVRLLLRVFKSIAERVAKLHEMQMVHFDLKCSNILLKLKTKTDGNVWFPSTEHPQFEVVLADFGFSRCYQGQSTLATVRNRGTEPCKAPEMLQIRGDRKRKSQSFVNDVRRGEAGAPSDVWSLGCLLFELLTGEMLYSGQEWARFYTQLTQEDSPLFTEDKIQLLHGAYRDQIKLLLKEILVRDQRKRPLIEEIITKVDELLEGGSLPPYQSPMDGGGSVLSGVRDLAVLDQEESEACQNVSYLCEFVQEVQFSLRIADLWISVFLLSNTNLLFSSESQNRDFMDLLITCPPLGVIYLDQSTTTINDLQDSSSCLGSYFLNKIKSMSSRKGFKALILSAESLDQDQGPPPMLIQAIEDWRTLAGQESRLVFCGNESQKSQILISLLQLIKTFECCNSLQAISKLKGRITHGI